MTDREFATWVADMIFAGKIEDEAFCELACRRLYYLDIVRRKDAEWELVEAEE